MEYPAMARAAMAFVLEDETWNVFVEWMKDNHVSAEAHDFAMRNPSRVEYRKQWLLNSEDEYIRSLADKL